MAEVNCLADFEMWVKPIKTGRKVTKVRIGWAPKDRERQKEALRELRPSRVGRKARIRGEVDEVADDHGWSEVDGLKPIGDALDIAPLARPGRAPPPRPRRSRDDAEASFTRSFRGLHVAARLKA